MPATHPVTTFGTLGRLVGEIIVVAWAILAVLPLVIEAAARAFR
jgi:hypothetical protein